MRNHSAIIDELRAKKDNEATNKAHEFKDWIKGIFSTFLSSTGYTDNLLGTLYLRFLKIHNPPGLSKSKSSEPKPKEYYKSYVTLKGKLHVSNF